MQTEELASVLVCVITCRRQAGLGRLLEALTEQVVTKSHFEILVVDNDAGGSARAVVDALADKAGAPIIYELEPRARDRLCTQSLCGDLSGVAA
jgi:hypothetical protein